jgi:hypothetical protein
MLKLKELPHEIEVGCWWYCWLDRALFRRIIWRWTSDILKLICYLLVLNFKFYFLLRCCKKVELALCMLLGQFSCKCVRGCRQPSGNFFIGIRGCWQPSGKFSIWCQRALAILQQSPQRVLATFAKKTHLSGSSDPLPEGIGYPLELLVVGIVLPLETFAWGCPLTKEGGQPFFQYLWKTLKLK